MRVRRRRAGILAGIFVAAAALFFFDPATTSFYPPCLFRTFLGFECPGCGSLRAAHQLLRGNLEEAWALNKALLIVAPLAAAISLFTFLRRSSSSPPSSPSSSSSSD
jgi:hypothetical protein